MAVVSAKPTSAMTTPGRNRTGTSPQGSAKLTGGSEPGMSPTIGPRYPASTEKSTPPSTATSAPGKRGWMRRAKSVIATVRTVSASAARFHDAGVPRTWRVLPTSPLSPTAAIPSVEGNCERRMRMAAPEVNPRTTGCDIR